MSMFLMKQLFKQKASVKSAPKLYIGADHAGFKLKEILKKKISANWFDVGAHKLSPKDDYPNFAKKLAKRVAKTKSIGILVCGSGAGMCIAANRFKKVRAVVGLDAYEVKMSRLHNDSNVLCLRSRNFPISKSIALARLWLSTPFSKEVRHVRRIKQL